MSLTTTTPSVTYTADGATLAYDFTFKMWQATVEDELVVVYQEGESDEATLALNTDYTISAANNDYSSGGTVTLVTGSSYITSGKTITIKSDLLRSQTMSLEVGGALNPITLEDILDRITRMIQEVELYDSVAQTSISAFYVTQLAKTTAKAAREALLIYPNIICIDNAVVCNNNEVVYI